MGFNSIQSSRHEKSIYSEWTEKSELCTVSMSVSVKSFYTYLGYTLYRLHLRMVGQCKRPIPTVIRHFILTFCRKCSSAVCLLTCVVPDKPQSELFLGRPRPSVGLVKGGDDFVRADSFDPYDIFCKAKMYLHTFLWVQPGRAGFHEVLSVFVNTPR